jgi:hypothetical protein
MGMDWHSSGITTSVIGALKRGLAPLEQELGVHAWIRTSSSGASGEADAFRPVKDRAR